MPIKDIVKTGSDSNEGRFGPAGMRVNATEKAANQKTMLNACSVVLSFLTYRYAIAAKNPEPRARIALNSTLLRSGETIIAMPMNDSMAMARTIGCTFSERNAPDSSATKSGFVYCSVTACPMGINPNAEK